MQSYFLLERWRSQYRHSLELLCQDPARLRRRLVVQQVCHCVLVLRGCVLDAAMGQHLIGYTLAVCNQV